MITMFCRENCPYTYKSQEYISQNFPRQPVRQVLVDHHPDYYKNYLTKVVQRPVSTFPQIFIDDKYVGGYTDLANKAPNQRGGSSTRSFITWLLQ